MYQEQYNLTEISKVAAHLISKLEHNIVCFEAKMGAGKTTLIKALLKELGIFDFEGSPTFSIVNEYKSATRPIYHFDLYRLEHIEELYDIGFEDYLDDNALIFIEWPQLAQPFLDEKVHHVTIDIVDETIRKLSLH